MTLLVCPKCDDLNEHARVGCESCGAILRIAESLVPEREKQRVRALTRRAVKRGLLPSGLCEHRRFSPCEGTLEWHHDEYGDPLNARRLCKRHHEDVHHPERRKAAA